ncbi:MAG: hypothetical protein K2H53_04295 [Clostridia bacterium]|nr:hypothetical protein [Clostridia bacterium]
MKRQIGENENNVLEVEIESENPSEANESSSNENTNVVEPPKVVDSPYYIKVNNQANVVTIYKKDSKR